MYSFFPNKLRIKGSLFELLSLKKEMLEYKKLQIILALLLVVFRSNFKLELRGMWYNIHVRLLLLLYTLQTTKSLALNSEELALFCLGYKPCNNKEYVHKRVISQNIGSS